MQHESKQNKPNKRRGGPEHGGEASEMARACRFLLISRADAALSVRLVGALGVAEGRVAARGLPHGEAWCAPVIANRCRSLLAARFAPGSGTAPDRNENEYCVPSQVSPPPGPPDRRSRGVPGGVAADAAHQGYRVPGEGKGRLGSCLNLNQLPRSRATPACRPSEISLPRKHMPRPVDWHEPCESGSVARLTLI
jgi:hypothetical protein